MNYINSARLVMLQFLSLRFIVEHFVYLNSILANTIVQVVLVAITNLLLMMPVIVSIQDFTSLMILDLAEDLLSLLQTQIYLLRQRAVVTTVRFYIPWVHLNGWCLTLFQVVQMI